MHELKYDGFRILVTHLAGEVKLLSRRGTPYHDIFPEIVAEVAQLPELAVDGELVMLDAEGRPQLATHHFVIPAVVALVSGAVIA